MAEEALYQKSFVLTVAESKRLIAKGVRVHPVVTRALKEGIVAVAKGTTNAYIVEELTGRKINKLHYCTGTTRPQGGKIDADIANKLPALVLRNGKQVEGVSDTQIVSEMKAGDVFMKGANALNYEQGQVAILIGHPTGGTIGTIVGTMIARRVCLLMPVGLEKSVPHDLEELRYLMTATGTNGSGPMLWPVQGEIFTELEALECLCGVEACCLAAGGIAGAEGSVRLAVWGSQEQLEKVDALLEEVQGEPAFTESV